MRHRTAEAVTAILLMLAATGAVLWAAETGNIEQQRAADTARALTGGEPARGRKAIAELGCGACHKISGVVGASGTVGPSLTALSSQVYGAAGEHTPDRLIAWIKAPREVRPDTAMPDLGVPESTARDIAAYLLEQN
jgi:cytochrome c2